MEGIPEETIFAPLTVFGYAFLVNAYLEASYKGEVSLNLEQWYLMIDDGFNFGGVVSDKLMRSGVVKRLVDSAEDFEEEGKKSSTFKKFSLQKHRSINNLDEFVDMVRPFGELMENTKSKSIEFLIDREKFETYTRTKISVREFVYLKTASDDPKSRVFKDIEVEAFYRRIKESYPDWMSAMDDMGIPETEQPALFSSKGFTEAYSRAEVRIRQKIEAAQIKSALAGSNASINAAIKRMPENIETNLISNLLSPTKPVEKKGARRKEVEITIASNA